MMKGDFPVGEFAGRKTPFYFYDLPLLERTLEMGLNALAE